MGLYESIMQSGLSQALDKVQTTKRGLSPMTPQSSYNPFRPIQHMDIDPYGGQQSMDPEYGVSEATPRITRELQFRTMSGSLSEKIFVVSSNVVSMSYNAKDQQLTVEFQRWVKGVGRVIGGGARYLYYNISLAEWKSAKTAGSKGKWVWAVLRRGGKTYLRVR